MPSAHTRLGTEIVKTVIGSGAILIHPKPSNSSKTPIRAATIAIPSNARRAGDSFRENAKKNSLALIVHRLTGGRLLSRASSI